MTKIKYNLLEKVFFQRYGDDTKYVGVIAEITELDALCEDENGNQYEENMYTVLTHDKEGNMLLEEVIEGDIEKY